MNMDFLCKIGIHDYQSVKKEWDEHIKARVEAQFEGKNFSKDGIACKPFQYREIFVCPRCEKIKDNISDYEIKYLKKLKKLKKAKQIWEKQKRDKN